MTSKSARHRAREFALQGIYAWIISGSRRDEMGAIDAHIQSDDAFQKADAEWYKTLLYGVFNQADQLRDLFTPLVDRPIVELSPIEHGALLLGAFELSEMLEVPYKVVINEAVELTKEFGGTDGFKFVNGVLDKLAAQLRRAELKPAS